MTAKATFVADESNNDEDVRMNMIDKESAEVDIQGDEQTELDAVCMVYVLYDYVAENEDELNLNEGDFVKVTELGTEEDMDWWNGYLSQDPGKYGTFPKNYVSLMLEFESTKYLISTDTNEVYNIDNIEDCLGVFDDSTYTLTDLDGIQKDWSAAILL